MLLHLLLRVSGRVGVAGIGSGYRSRPVLKDRSAPVPRAACLLMKEKVIALTLQRGGLEPSLPGA
jgi:hypothetical protein